MSKMFTAVAVLQLVERKQVCLDDALVGFVKEHMPQLDPRVTVHHALTMTAGIGDWFEEGSDDWEAEWAALTSSHPLYLLRSNKDYLSLFALQAAPLPSRGASSVQRRYYILLGLLIESVTGRSFEEVIADDVFARAGMSAAGFPALDDLGPDIAEGYLTTAAAPPRTGPITTRPPPGPPPTEGLPVAPPI